LLRDANTNLLIAGPHCEGDGVYPNDRGLFIKAPTTIILDPGFLQQTNAAGKSLLSTASGTPLVTDGRRPGAAQPPFTIPSRTSSRCSRQRRGTPLHEFYVDSIE
jgi:hypothetical protein